jgi:hypothetical protein
MKSESPTPEQASALDELVAMILDPATPPVVLAIDVPFKAALLGLSWRRLEALFAERDARQRRPGHRTRARRR